MEVAYLHSICKANDSCMAGKQLYCVPTASKMFKKQDSFENNGISLSLNPF